MTEQSDLQNWRSASRDTPGTPVREAARQAMIAEVVSAREANAFRPGRRAPWWAAAAAVAAGLIVVGVRSNAPAPSPAPTMTNAALAAAHLKAAEKALGAASHSADRAVTLANAESELQKTKPLLGTDTHSALWQEWTRDEERLHDDQTSLQSPSAPRETETPDATATGDGTQTEHQDTGSSSQPETAAPTESTGSDSGGDTSTQHTDD